MNEVQDTHDDKKRSTISRAESELSRLLEWIRAADSKLKLVLPLSTTMLGALAVLIPPPTAWTLLGGITVSFAVVFLVLSIIFAAISSFPRTSGPQGSLIYFGGIVTRDLGQFESAFRNLNDTEYLGDLLRQCHRNAHIADQKYTWLQRSLACMFISAVPWAIGLFELYSGTS